MILSMASRPIKRHSLVHRLGVSLMLCVHFFVLDNDDVMFLDDEHAIAESSQTISSQLSLRKTILDSANKEAFFTVYAN